MRAEFFVQIEGRRSLVEAWNVKDIIIADRERGGPVANRYRDRYGSLCFCVFCVFDQEKCLGLTF